MRSPIVHEIVNLPINGLVCYLIWNHYRESTYSADQRYSTFAPRFWTGTVDRFVVAPVALTATALFALQPPRIITALIFIVENLAWVAYTIVMHARCGQTVGKMVTRVRVVDFATEGSISWLQASIREGIPALISVGLLGYLVSAIVTGQTSPDDPYRPASPAGTIPYRGLFALPLLWFAAEVVTMLTNPKRRALHDLLAGTVVIRTNCQPAGIPVPAGGDPSIPRDA
jgi:uncharacterized RDD family membrane protein YckC